MSTTLPPKSESSLLADGSPVRYRITLQQFHEMADAGIFGEQDSVELIRGDLVPKMVIGNRHAACVNRLNRLFAKSLPDSLLISVQNPVTVMDSEVGPDVAILKFCEDLYAARRSTVEDVCLLIEVSDTSLQYDREVKASLYAEGGIKEYWIVNLINNTVEIHDDPQADGRYGSLRTMSVGDRLSVPMISDMTFDVADIIGDIKS